MWKYKNNSIHIPIKNRILSVASLLLSGFSSVPLKVSGPLFPCLSYLDEAIPRSLTTGFHHNKEQCL